MLLRTSTWNVESRNVTDDDPLNTVMTLGRCTMVHFQFVGADVDFVV